MSPRYAGQLALFAAASLLGTVRNDPPQAGGTPEVLFVDASRGRDDNPGTETKPLRSISAALAQLPEPLEQPVTIRIAVGAYATTGGHGMPEQSLQLARRMRPEGRVTLAGVPGRNGEPPVLAWPGERRMIEAEEGRWRLENLQIGSGATDQRRGVFVRGPAEVLLRDVRFRLRSDSDHGIVEFLEREGASLDLGNGSLSASYYGSIRLGCEWARITCWNRNSNNLSIGNGGRIDLRNTATTLRARVAENTPVGLEHDGHILAEDAHLTIEGRNKMAIALQKASSFTCNDVELQGEFETAVWAASGSLFVGRFLTDIGGLEADTGAGIHVEKISGSVRGPVQARHGGLISLPDRTVRGD